MHMHDQDTVHDTVEQMEARLQHLRRVTEEIATQHDEVADQLCRQLAPDRIQRLRDQLGMIDEAGA